MFIERNEFHLKFGMAAEAKSQWKDFLEKAVKVKPDIKARLLSDLTGRGYTIVLELSYPSYAELEPSRCLLTNLPGWKTFYNQFIPLCETSHRTLYKLEASL
jgi:hypothetical protein